jgi:hypothetical protein
MLHHFMSGLRAEGGAPTFFVAVHLVEDGTEQKSAAVQRYFGCQGVSGPMADMAGMIEDDPEEKCTVRSFCSAQPRLRSR